MTLYPQKITTFGENREPGVRDVLIYCRDHRCSQVNADRWPDRRSERDEMLAEHGQMDFKRAARAQSSGAREMAERRTGWSREFDEPIASERQEAGHSPRRRRVHYLVTEGR